MADLSAEVVTPATETQEPTPQSSGTVSRYLRPDQLLRKWSISLTNALEPGILQKMSEFGYSADRIGFGAEMHERVTALFAKQKQEYGEQLEASQVLAEAFANAETTYMRTIKIARIAFEGDTSATAALLLSGARSKAVSKWSRQADTFYRNLLASPSFIEKMAFYGYTAEKLQAEHALVDEVITADAKHKKERGESQEATAVRDAAFDELADWMSKFYQIARIACVGEHQWLEKLGIKE